MASEQNYSNHRRYNPWHHFVVLPILSINLAVEIQRLIKDPSASRGWQVVLARNGTESTGSRDSSGGAAAAFTTDRRSGCH